MTTPTSDDNLHPRGGVRVLLALVASDGSGARYRGSLFCPTSRPTPRVDCDVAIAASGAVTLSPTSAEVGAKLVDLLRTLARRAFKDAAATKPPRWPDRVLVWRPLDEAPDAASRDGNDAG